MPEGLDEAAFSFSQEIAPDSRPRDIKGKFVETPAKPESMFSLRELEGDPLTGDTRDGGDDPRLRAREKDIADGRSERVPERDTKNQVEQHSAEGGNDGDTEVDARSESEDEADDEAGEKYEVVIDGKTEEISLKEALRGYIREATFHQKLEKLKDVQQQVDTDIANLANNWKIWLKAKAGYEEDVANITPKELDWDLEFRRYPNESDHDYALKVANAHSLQNIHKKIAIDLLKSRQDRAEREAIMADEENRRVQKYAVEGFEKFVMDNLKEIPDKPTLDKELKSMRRTMRDLGFTEYETNTVYDPRMLTGIWWASRFRRMTANSPVVVVSGKGRTLTPGAATPIGNARRSGLDEAQRRLAQSGKLSDAEDVFRKMF